MREREKDCIFCKIIDKEIPADIVYEDEKAVVFRDIKPKAPLHLLIIPKEHISSIDELQESDINTVGHLLLVAKEVAKNMGVADTGYRLAVNVGKGGGQEVFHIHIHLMANKN